MSIIKMSPAALSNKQNAVDIIRFCMHTNQYLNGMAYKQKKHGIYGEDLLLLVPEGTGEEECHKAIVEFCKTYELNNLVVRVCPESWFRLAMILEDNLMKYPPFITNKYKMCTHAFYFDKEGEYRYQGPKIKIEVRSIGVQHFGVFEQPQNKLLKAFQSKRGSQAHNDACMHAEQLELPWKSHFGDYFEPKAGLVYTNLSF